MVELGTLEKLDLRTVWPHEAHDFTPWLAENVGLLGDALGMELELEGSETAVGTFALDLLARDLGRDRLVVIENQFASTDHDHLGKLLTYAGGYDAAAVVWVCETLREEHRQALDWLNRRTDTDTHFFAVVIEVLQIDDSKPAFQLKPVVEPNEWQKLQKTRRDSAPTERGEAYRDYFQALIDELREEYQFTQARIAQPQNWYAFSAGISSVSYGAVFVKEDRVRTELYIGTPDASLNEALFDWLHDQKEAVESEMGAELEWSPLEDKKACRIYTDRPGTIEDDSETLEKIHNWHIEWLLRFKQVLDERIQEFKENHQQ